jgi:hypothetical protein
VLANNSDSTVLANSSYSNVIAIAVIAQCWQIAVIAQCWLGLDRVMNKVYKIHSLNDDNVYIAVLARCIKST